MGKISLEASGDEIENRFIRQDEKAIRDRRDRRYIHLWFTQHDNSLINGRPHHLHPWLAGILTGLGARRDATRRR